MKRIVFALGVILSIVLGATGVQAQPSGTGIRIQNRYFLTAANNGGLGTGQDVPIRTDTRTVGPNEKFKIIALGDYAAGQFALQTPDGRHYVTAVNNGGMGGPNDSTSPLHTDAVAHGPWESFVFEPQPDGTYAIRTTTGYYLSAAGGGGWGEASNGFPVHTDAVRIGPWETFTFVGTKPPLPTSGSQIDTNSYYRLTNSFRGEGECLEGNQASSPVHSGAAFMDKCQNVSGQLWKLVPEGEWYRLKTQFQGADRCLEGNQAASPVHDGAAFMDTCQNVSGQLWKLVKVQ